MYYNFLQNKIFVITSDTSSLSHELFREDLKYDPKVVHVFDVDETKQFEFQHELKDFHRLFFEGFTQSEVLDNRRKNDFDLATYKI